MTEPLAPTPKMQISVSETPAPPWAGVKFPCVKCKGEYQLEAADVCELRFVLNDHIKAYAVPPCPTEDCGHINVITIDERKKK